jgi:hypothetical protein
MSAWRRMAIEKLPECRDLIQGAKNPYQFWIDLRFEFEDAHREPTNTDFVSRVYEYASWAANESGNPDLCTAAAVAFYEHLPTMPLVRREKARWISRPFYHELRDLLRYHLSESEFEEFEAEFWRRKDEIDRVVLAEKKASRKAASR